jgi:hypothetical protein
MWKMSDSALCQMPCSLIPEFVCFAILPTQPSPLLHVLRAIRLYAADLQFDAQRVADTTESVPVALPTARMDGRSCPRSCRLSAFGDSPVGQSNQWLSAAAAKSCVKAPTIV